MDGYSLGSKNLNNSEIDPIYKKGFEHGYWLERGNSQDLDRVIEGSKNHFQYMCGLKAGKKEAELEQKLLKLKAIKQKQEEKQKGKER